MPIFELTQLAKISVITYALNLPILDANFNSQFREY
jgi:hypothetical protein